MRVAECLKLPAFLPKVPKNLSAFFLAASLMKELVNSFHSDRASFQLSVVHGAPGTSVQFISYFEISWPIGEGERGVPLSHVRGHELFGVKGLPVRMAIYRHTEVYTHAKNIMLFIFVCIILMCSYVQQFVYNIQCAVTCILACRTLALVFIKYGIQTAGPPPSLHGQHSYFEIGLSGKVSGAYLWTIFGVMSYSGSKVYISTTIPQPLICCLHYVHQYILVYILYIILYEKGSPNGGCHHIIYTYNKINIYVYILYCMQWIEWEYKSHDIKIIIGRNTL